MSIPRAPVGTGVAAHVTAEPPNTAWTLVLASVGVFMTALDTLVVANSLPTLRESLSANLGDGLLVRGGRGQRDRDAASADLDVFDEAERDDVA